MTTNHIQSSLDWNTVQAKIEQSAHKLKKYNYEMLKLSNNIGRMVTDLSREEITCRRLGHQTQQHQEMVDKINQSITEYEQMITFAVLING
jgi:predicted  nucleic acid-binding Zn-ribbon protein